MTAARTVGSARTAAIAGAALAVAALASTSRADDLDLAPIAGRVDAALANPATQPSLRALYVKLDKALSKRNRAGLADDFAKLERVAVECRGALYVDLDLCTALGLAVDAGLDAALPAEDVAVARLSAVVASASSRRKIGASVTASRRSLGDAVNARDNGQADLACRVAAQSAAKLAAARRAAEAAVRVQDRKAAKWTVVLEHRAGPLLSVWTGPGTTAEAYVVGADDGGGPQFLRGSGEGWVQIPVAPAGDLWWVTRVPGDGMWACGADGLVVRYDPATGAVEDRSPPGITADLYGIWGSDPTNVITVGIGGPNGHAFLRWDGAAWSDIAGPPEADGKGLMKIWGRSADDLYVCGKSGTLIHFDGTTWTSVPVTALGGGKVYADLLTVHGNATSVIAVGSVTEDAIVERRRSGAFAEAVLPTATTSVAGVFVPARGDAWACGYNGELLRKKGGKWRAVAGAPDAGGRDLHAVFIDDNGAVWVAGGDIRRMEDGFLHYLGRRPPSSEVVARAGFASQVHSVLTRAETCSEVSCHAGKFAALGLDLLEREVAYGGLVGVASAQSPQVLVLPGRPSASYLWRKLTNSHLAAGGSGTEMPQGRDALPAQEMDAIRAWILEGAPDSQ